jgi:hypothetical protein
VGPQTSPSRPTATPTTTPTPTSNYVIQYPVRAVHIGGLFSFNQDFTLICSPTYYLGGSSGDLKNIGIMNYPDESITVDVSASAVKYIEDNPGRSLVYASLEVVLVDNSNRVVGWGTTATNPSVNPTNGTGGTTMTVHLFDFPNQSNSWILGGLSANGWPVSDLIPITPYKQLSSNYLQQIFTPTPTPTPTPTLTPTPTPNPTPTLTPTPENNLKIYLNAENDYSITTELDVNINLLLLQAF